MSRDGRIPQTVPEFLQDKGRRNGRGEWVAECPVCGTLVLGAYLRSVGGQVCCTSCKRSMRVPRLQGEVQL